MRAFWAEGKQQKNVELCFVRTMERVDGAEILLVAKDVYNLYVNGRFVQYGPARAAKGYARLERIAIGKYLTEEENEIAIYVQSNDTKTLCFAWEKPMFAAEIVAGCNVLYTTEDFVCFAMNDKLQKVERMSFQRGYVEVYRMQKNRHPFDKNAFPRCNLVAVEMPDLLERGVAVATHEAAVAQLYEAGGVHVDSTRVWENDFTRQLDTGHNLFSFTRAECESVISKEILSFVLGDAGSAGDGVHRHETYAFDRTHCGKFRLTLVAKTAATVWLAYDDILIDGKVKFHREQIIHGLKWDLAAGEYTLDSNEVYTAKYVALILQGDVEIRGVSMLRVENPHAERMEFSCEDKALQSIVEAARHSFAHNGYDLLTDCPSRERAGYMCDGFFAARAEAFFCGENVVEKNLLENYALYPCEHFAHPGILPMCYPSEPFGQDDFIPNWVLWWVLELEDYTLRTGDTLFAEWQEARLRAVLNYFAGKENEYGLLEDLDGWVFVEWSRANDFVVGVNFPSNMCYYGAMKAAARMLQDDALLEKAEALKQTILRFSYNGTFFVDNAVRENGVLTVTNNISETCQNYAAFFEIFTREENPAFYKRLVDELGCFHREHFHADVHASNMFIGYILRLSVLLREGACKEVLAECKERFAGMASSTGTIWELFQTNASCNHGFGSIVGQMIVYALCGVRGVNEQEKQLVLAAEHTKQDVHAVLPLRGGAAMITVKDGKRHVEIIGNYVVRE